MQQKHYYRLSLEERCQISAYLQRNLSLRLIAKELGRNVSTISRELNRNSIWAQSRYQAPLAHSESKKRRLHCHRHFKIQGEDEGILVHLLLQRFSPEQVASQLGTSTQTIYNFIYTRDRMLKVLLRRYNKRGAGRYLQRKKQQKDGRVFIDMRPKGVDKRARFGHWERDTAYAKNGYLFVCVERKSRLIKLAKINKLNAKQISQLSDELTSDCPFKCKSYTNDNGSEFSDGKNMKTPVYYCHAMNPQQRGTVENTIGLLRDYITRQTDLNLFSDDDIKDIELSLNSRPRKCLGFRSPLEASRCKMLH
jgi:IS30 family transposase